MGSKVSVLVMALSLVVSACLVAHDNTIVCWDSRWPGRFDRELGIVERLLVSGHRFNHAARHATLGSSSSSPTSHSFSLLPGFRA